MTHPEGGTHHHFRDMLVELWQVVEVSRERFHGTVYSATRS
jgi:hypothetical protein